MSEPIEPLYRIEGDWVVPGDGTVSPWSAGLQSGHAVAGVLMALAGRVPAPVPMQPVRCTVNLARPVPRVPLRWHSEVLREGGKLQMLRITLAHEERTVTDLTVLRMRLGDSDALPSRHPGYPAPEQCQPVPMAVAGYEVRTPGGRPVGNGAGPFWLRLTVPLVAGEPLTPLVHAMLLADWGSGMNAELSFDQWQFPNVDIALHLFRQPRGEWLLLDGSWESAGGGTALISAAMADRDGTFGRTHQTLIVDRR